MSNNVDLLEEIADLAFQYLQGCPNCRGQLSEAARLRIKFLAEKL